jgi:DNA topoisomerase-1
LAEIDARAVNTIDLGTDSDGLAIVLRVGKFGPYLEREGDRASVPDDLPPDELTVEKAMELLAAQPAGDKILGTDPESGLTVLAKTGRFGPYVQLGEVAEGGPKPRTSSLLKSMSLDSVSLDDALQLLSLPRVIGADPDTGEEILAHQGRYGPYLARGTERRSLEEEAELFTVTLDQARELFAQPPRRQGRGRAAEPPRVIGNQPETGKPISIRKGRYGPYVTDGETNASIRTGDDPESLTLERALELLEARKRKLEESGETKKKPRRRN